MTNETPGLSFGSVLAFGALVGVPLIASVFGFVMGVIAAIFYNFLSKWLGIDLNIK